MFSLSVLIECPVKSSEPRLKKFNLFSVCSAFVIICFFPKRFCSLYVFQGILILYLIIEFIDTELMDYLLYFSIRFTLFYKLALPFIQLY